jgi:phosphate transport system substrate-binding protein
MRHLRIVGLVVLILTSLLSACPARQSTPTPLAPPALVDVSEAAPIAAQHRLRIAAHPFLQLVVEALIEPFSAAYPNIILDRQVTAGSLASIRAVGEGTADLSSALGDATLENYRQYPNLQATTVGTTGLAIVVHPDVKIDSLSMDQTRAIFTGQVTNFRDVGGPDIPIVVVSALKSQSVYYVFQSVVIARHMAGGQRAEITRNATYLPADRLSDHVAATPGGISVVPFGYIGDKVHPVTLDGVAPTVDNLMSGAYPLPIPINIFTLGPPAGSAKSFVDSALAPAGQARLSQVPGGVPLNSLQAVVVPARPLRAAPRPSPTPIARPTPAPNRLMVVGSATMHDCVSDLAGAFKKIHPGVEVEVLGGYSEVALLSVTNHVANLGMVSTPIEPAMLQQYPEMHAFTIGYDGLAVFTYPRVELPDLTLAQLQGIFSGAITNYNEVDGPLIPITVVLPPVNSNLRTSFASKVMAYTDANGQSQVKRFAATALVAPSVQEIPALVRTTPGAIAFLPLNFLAKDIRPVPINGVALTADAVQSERYPMVLALNLINDGTPSDLEQAFIDFAQSVTGQRIVARYFAPLR